MSLALVETQPITMVVSKNQSSKENNHEVVRNTCGEKVFNIVTDKVLSKYDKLDRGDAEYCSLRFLEDCFLTNTTLFRTKEELVRAMDYLSIGRRAKLEYLASRKIEEHDQFLAIDNETLSKRMGF